MGISTAFWIVFLIWTIFGVYNSWPTDTANRSGWLGFGGGFLFWLLILILGWGVFGAPLK